MGLSDAVSSGVDSIAWDCGIVWLGVGIVGLSNRETDGAGIGSEGKMARNKWAQYWYQFSSGTDWPFRLLRRENKAARLFLVVAVSSYFHPDLIT